MVALSRAALISVGAFLCGGCGGAEGVVERFVARDSLGIRVVDNAAPAVPELVRLQGTPEVVVAPDFGAPDHYLFGVSGIVGLPSGGFAVGNSETQQLFLFTESGQFIRAVGGQGDGPGELQAVWGLSTCAAGQMAVRELSRVSFFDARGEFLRTVRIPGHLAESRAGFEGISKNCQRALMSLPPRDPPSSRDELRDLHSTYYWASVETGAADTIGTLNVRYAQAREFRGRLVWSRVPYGPEGVLAIHPEGVALASGRVPEVTVLDENGSPDMIIRWMAEVELVSDADWSYFTESRQNLVDEHPQEAAFVPDEDFYFRPETKPAVAELLVDDGSRLWVGAYDRGGISGPSAAQEWSVFSPAGRWLARVSMPDGFTLMAVAGNRILGTSRDGVDAEHIEVYPVPDLRPLEDP